MAENPVRILHILGGLHRGGAETFIVNIYRQIDRSKIQFDFVIHTEEKGSYYSEIISLGGRVFSCPKYTGKNHFVYVDWWKNFFENHPEYKAIHSHIRSSASLYLSLAKKHGIKTIIHSHSTSNGKGFSSLIKRVLQYPLRYIADYLFACSKESGEWLFGKKAAKAHNFYIIKNSIDLEKCSFNADIRNKYRNEMNLMDKKVFIHVGRLHPSKNHMFLLDLFKEISKRDSNSVLLIVGDGELREQIAGRVNELGLQESVLMLGSRGDVGSLFQAADYFLFPSIWEGVPLTVIEAQASGLPCLVSDTITSDINISDLVTSLPIDKGVTPWIEKISNLNFIRKDVHKNIISAGYDSKTLAKWIEEFYLSAISMKG